MAEFMTHVQYVVETCPATYFVGNLNSDISITFPKKFRKTLTALDQNILPSVLINMVQAS